MSNKVPQIRFNGYSDDWVQRKFSEVIQKIQTGTNDLGSETNSGTPLLKMGNIQRGYFDLSKLEKLQDDLTESDPNVVAYGDFLFNTRNTLLLVGKGATWRGVSSLYAFNSNIARFTFNGLNTIFFNYLYNTPKMINEIQRRAVGTTSVAAVYPRDLNSLRFFVPSEVEQDKIGYLFTALDDLIAANQRKLDLLKEQKKGYLQKMFPKNGAKVPELRFAGFADDWEQCKLSDEMTDFIVPMRDKPKEFGGNIPWTRIEDIEGKFLNDSLSEQYVTEETIQKMNLKIIPKDSLIVSSSATFGVVAVVTQDLITNQTFIGLVPREKNTIDYWYSFFQSSEARKYMKLQSAGSTIFYIARDSFEKMPISVPKIDEMIKIGEYFSNLDNLIALHQRKLELLKEQKKGFLQKMFV